jgi:hypothetical protein
MRACRACSWRACHSARSNWAMRVGTGVPAASAAASISSKRAAMVLSLRFCRSCSRSSFIVGLQIEREVIVGDPAQYHLLEPIQIEEPIAFGIGERRRGTPRADSRAASRATVAAARAAHRHTALKAFEVTRSSAARSAGSRSARVRAAVAGKSLAAREVDAPDRSRGYRRVREPGRGSRPDAAPRTGRPARASRALRALGR